MSSVSTPYEDGGRSEQKRRTRESLVAAARELVGSGVEPTVELAAARAGISRTTAYRYFPNQRALVLAAHPETGAVSLLPSDPPADVAERLDAVISRFTHLIADTEAAQRTMLRLSLEPSEGDRGTLPLRQGRAIGWIGEALEPLRDRMSRRELHALVLAVRAATGIEARVWLTDIGGLSASEVEASMRWSAQALLQAAMTTGPPRVSPRQARPARR
jgi:AcrR family transcriptional regulator